MIKHKSKDAKEDLETFRKFSSEHLKSRREYYGRLWEDAPEEFKSDIINQIKKEMEWMFDLHPYYVGKRWLQCNASRYPRYCRVSNIEWEFPDITNSDKLYPVVKSMKIDDHDVNGKITYSMTYNYPEEDWFLDGWVNRKSNDIDDD
jgi:hypothetical protein